MLSDHNKYAQKKSQGNIRVVPVCNIWAGNCDRLISLPIFENIDNKMDFKLSRIFKLEVLKTHSFELHNVTFQTTFDHFAAVFWRFMSRFRDKISK